MVKKNVKPLSTKTVDAGEKPTWTPTSLLDSHDSNRSTMKETKLDAIEKKNHLEMDFGIVFYSCTTKKFNGCRYSLVSKKKYEPLVLNLEVAKDRE